jgi:hypothetical protein
MTTTTFNSLGYFEKLKAAGMPEEQAKIVANTTREIVDEQLVTKEYLDARLRELEYRLQYSLTIRLGGMMAAAIAIVAALVRLT